MFCIMRKVCRPLPRLREKVANAILHMAKSERAVIRQDVAKLAPLRSRSASDPARPSSACGTSTARRGPSPPTGQRYAVCLPFTFLFPGVTLPFFVFLKNAANLWSAFCDHVSLSKHFRNGSLPSRFSGKKGSRKTKESFAPFFSMPFPLTGAFQKKLLKVSVFFFRRDALKEQRKCLCWNSVPNYAKFWKTRSRLYRRKANSCEMLFLENQNAFWGKETFKAWSGAHVCNSCRSRNMLESEYLLAKIGFDSPENGLSEAPTRKHKSFYVF